MDNCTSLFWQIHHLVENTQISQTVACSVRLDSDSRSTVDGDSHTDVSGAMSGPDIEAVGEVKAPILESLNA
jgi:hypothetical protein